MDFVTKNKKMNRKKYLAVKKWTLAQVWVKDKETLMLLIRQNMKNNSQEKWKINNNKTKNKIKIKNKIQIRWRWKMTLVVKTNSKEKMRNKKNNQKKI